MADIGTAYVRVAPNMTGIQGKIARGFKGSAGPATRALGDEVNKNSGPFQNALGKLGGFAKKAGKGIAIGLGVGVAGIAALTGKAVMAGAELEQQLGGAEAVFGEYADGIKAAAEDAYKNAGLSQQEFLQGANKMGSLFQGVGFDVQKSMQMSQDSMQRASDIASIMGISTSDALAAVTGMAKGNLTMMDNLGVAMNDTTLNAYALEKGIGKTTAQMSIQEKVGLAQQLFMEKTAKYAGNYAKENETLSGSLNTTKKAFDNLLTGQGDVDDFVDSLIGTIEIAVPKIIELMPKLVQGIESIIKALVPALAKALPTLVPAAISAIVALLNAIVAALPTVVSVLLQALPTIIKAFIDLFMALIMALPAIVRMISEALPTIIDALVTGLTDPTAIDAMIQATIELLLALVDAIPMILPPLIKAIPKIIFAIIGALWRNKGRIFSAGVQLIRSLISAIGSTLGAVGSAAKEIFNKIKDTLSPSNLARVGSDMIRGMWRGIQSLGGWIKDKIIGFVKDKIPGPVKKVLGINSPSKLFAEFGKNVDEGFAKGIVKHANNVESAVTGMANQAVDGMFGSAISPALAFNPSVSNGAGSGNTTNQTVSISKIVLGDEGAVREFFKQLDRDTISTGMGLTPAQGAM